MSPIQVHNLDRVEAWGDGSGGGGILRGGRNPGDRTDYYVRITSADDSQSSRSGYPQIALQFENEQGEIRDWIVVIESTFGKVRQFYEAVGIEIQGGDWILPVQSLIGRTVRITVEEQATGDYLDNGQPRMKSRVVAYASAKQPLSGPVVASPPQRPPVAVRPYGGTPVPRSDVTSTDDSIPF